ncbi:hypothetical protein XA68_14136 [Ophiocordyceps unilateralis]|uniref:Uncharacterized protein n=1 Tax=Ophiocordyceps unilateralis TaxID=268505 RepID=A0A2A9PAS4_OPHUN|nr:hypothetical protein XA68_14136 [Ophiocordyceps unilateralis]
MWLRSSSRVLPTDNSKRDNAIFCYNYQARNNSSGILLSAASSPNIPSKADSIEVARNSGEVDARYDAEIFLQIARPSGGVLLLFG